MFETIGGIIAIWIVFVVITEFIASNRRRKLMDDLIYFDEESEFTEEQYKAFAEKLKDALEEELDGSPEDSAS